MVRIAEVDPQDEASLRAFHETEQAAIRHDRPDAVARTWEAIRVAAQSPSPYYRRTFLTAVEDNRTVGVADLGRSVGDNEHLADLEINVLADHRRRGIGRALWDEADRRRRADGRSTVRGEAYVRARGPAGASPAYAFAQALGFESVHQEDHLALRLPVEPTHLATIRSAIRGRAHDYEIVTWWRRCPDEYAAAYCAMITQMYRDVPLGESDHQPTVYDEKRLRTQEQRVASAYDQLVAAARRSEDGTFAGYSQLSMPVGRDHVIQDHTLVMPDHRGHRLGTTLKLVTLDILQSDRPERSSIHTWTDPENLAMYRTNTALGFRLVDRMHEMQRKDA